MLSVLYDDAVKCQDRKFLFYGITVGSLPFIASSPFGGGGWSVLSNVRSVTSNICRRWFKSCLEAPFLSIFGVGMTCPPKVSGSYLWNKKWKEISSAKTETQRGLLLHMFDFIMLPQQESLFSDLGRVFAPSCDMLGCYRKSTTYKQVSFSMNSWGEVSQKQTNEQTKKRAAEFVKNERRANGNLLYF